MPGLKLTTKQKISYFGLVLIFIYAIFAGYINYRATWFTIDKHFSLLAKSFIGHDLALSPMNLPNGDYVDFHAKQYLFFGPMPSIILIPFVFIWGKNFPQLNLSLASLIITYVGIFALTRKFKFSRSDSFWLANFFVFGTVLYFVGLINISAYIVQAVATAAVVLSLWEYFTKRRWLLIGTLVAAAIATRMTLLGMTVFYVLEIFRQRQKINLHRALVLFLIPIFFALSMLGLYNYKRFHSPFETGYNMNVSALNKNYYNWNAGFFSPIHIPANLYVLLIKTPEPVRNPNVEFVLQFPYLKADGFGMAIWFTSPLFIYLLRSSKKPYTKSALIAIAFLVLPSLLYWGIGAAQFGYRYSLDFLPLLFLILLSAFSKGLPTFAKVLIFVGIIFDCFYMLSIWDSSYPLLSFWQYLN